MTDWLDSTPFPPNAFLPRVTVRDGRALEQALAGNDLWQSPGAEIKAAIVEASYAATDPQILRRFREAGVPYLVDSQPLRFATGGFREVRRLADLPYAPDSPLVPGINDDDLERFVGGTFEFQVGHGAAVLLGAAVPLHDDDLERRLELFRRCLRLSARLNGRAGTDRLPLFAVVPPGHALLANPEPLIDLLADAPLSGFYVQPLRFRPTYDSVEKLLLYVRFLHRLKSFGLPVIAGRVGAFGLLLQPFGIGLFDSGLGEAEQFDLASLNRSRNQLPADRETGARGDTRLYLEPLKTTLRGRHARAIIAERLLRAHFACGLRCCRFRGFDDLLDRRREHYLHTRCHEVDQLASEPSDEMRLESVHRDVVTAQENGRLVRNALREREIEPPSFEHLDRWLALLARATQAPVRTV